MYVIQSQNLQVAIAPNVSGMEGGHSDREARRGPQSGCTQVTQDLRATPVWPISIYGHIWRWFTYKTQPNMVDSVWCYFKHVESFWYQTCAKIPVFAGRFLIIGWTILNLRGQRSCQCWRHGQLNNRFHTTRGGPQLWVGLWTYQTTTHISYNVGKTMINHPFPGMVYTTHFWWFGGWWCIIF